MDAHTLRRMRNHNRQTVGDEARRTPAEETRLRLWALRLLVPLGLYKKFVKDKDFEDDDVARLVGLGDTLGELRIDYT